MQSECVSHLFPCHAIYSKLRQAAASQELRGLHFSHSSAPTAQCRVEVGPPAISLDFVGKLLRYVHCTRRALSFLDWCGSLAVLNVGTTDSPIGGSRWPNGQLLRAVGSGSSIA